MEKQKTSIDSFIVFILIAMTACCGSDNKRTSTQNTMDVYFREFTDGANKFNARTTSRLYKNSRYCLRVLIESD